MQDNLTSDTIQFFKTLRALMEQGLKNLDHLLSKYSNDTPATPRIEAIDWEYEITKALGILKGFRTRKEITDEIISSFKDSGLDNKSIRSAVMIDLKNHPELIKKKMNGLYRYGLKKATLT